MMPAQRRGATCTSSSDGKREGEVGAGQGVLGVASVYGVAGEGGVVAEVFHMVAAVPAIPIDAADPQGDTGTAYQRQLGCRDRRLPRPRFDGLE